MRPERRAAHKLVIGSGPMLRQALQAWAEMEPAQTLHAIDVGQDAHYRFDLQALAEALAQPCEGAERTAFVAWGPQFLNFRRLELMGELKARGLKMPPLVSRHAIVAADAVVGENCAIGAGSVIGHGCTLGYNSVVGAGCILGAGTQVGPSAWITDGVQVGSGCRIGSQATLGQGVILADGVSVGRQSVLELPGHHSHPVTDKTLLSPRFRGAVTIVDGAAAPAPASPPSKPGPS